MAFKASTGKYAHVTSLHVPMAIDSLIYMSGKYTPIRRGPVKKGSKYF